MMTIIDILIYVCFAFYASSLARKSENYIRENHLSPEKWDKYLIYFVLFFSIIGGLRWNVGVDSAVYAAIFDHLELDFSREKLWAYLAYFFQSNGINWRFGLAFCAFVQIFFITQILKPYRWLLIFIPFVFFGGRYWLDTMNAVRQMMVGCAFLWASQFIVDKKPVYYAAFIIIGSMIHQSALLLIPFYFLPNWLHIENRRWILTGILLCCLVIGQTPAFQEMGEYIEFIVGATNYDDKIDRITELITINQTNEILSFGPMMLSYLLIPLFIIWYGPTLRDEYESKIPYFNLWFNLAYFYACGYFLVCNISHYYIRPMMYFGLFQMVMAAMLLRYFWLEFRAYGILQTATYLFCVIIAINTCWDIYKSSGRFFESTTYKISFFHKDQQKWFGL